MMAAVFLPKQRHAATTRLSMDVTQSGGGFDRGGLNPAGVNN